MGLVYKQVLLPDLPDRRACHLVPVTIPPSSSEPTSFLESGLTRATESFWHSRSRDLAEKAPGPAFKPSSFATLLHIPMSQALPKRSRHTTSDNAGGVRRLPTFELL